MYNAELRLGTTKFLWVMGSPENKIIMHQWFLNMFQKRSTKCLQISGLLWNKADSYLHIETESL